MAMKEDGTIVYNTISTWYKSYERFSGPTDGATAPAMIGSYVFNLGFVSGASLTFCDGLNNQIMVHVIDFLTSSGTTTGLYAFNKEVYDAVMTFHQSFETVSQLIRINRGMHSDIMKARRSPNDGHTKLGISTFTYK
uniref:uncharacterized protein LOC120336029 n=1 Tax=Styela clava TaxID=7725 RepID=UPI0019399930|nr:uncharacterized protein LOC120336029 [Styela clava]